MPNIFDRFKSDKLKTILGGYCWFQDGGNGGYDFNDVEEFIKQFLKQELKSLIAKTIGEEIMIGNCCIHCDAGYNAKRTELIQTYRDEGYGEIVDEVLNNK